MISSSLLLFSLLLLFKTSLAACKYKLIHNASELIEFSNDVNSGTTYEDYAVYLVNDIIFDEQLSKQFEPIGKDKDNYFPAVFDGQGYIISNLTLKSSSYQYCSLFGFTSGSSIKNIVLDDSCSISSSYENTGVFVFVSGINGLCEPNNNHCTIENSVNMANISFSGTSNNLYLGGISGNARIANSRYEGNVINCVNYGAIYNSGSSGTTSLIGGIVGECYTDASGYGVHVYNCLNYGTVTNEGRSSYNPIGGITSRSWGGIFINCMSTGKVTSSSGGHIGGIYSEVWGSTTVTHCYWTSGTNCDNYYGSGSNSQDTASKITALESGNANELNSYAINENWNEWTFNQNKVSIKFVVHNGKGFSYSSQLILIPVAERRGYSFLFWCVNENSTDNCIEKYNRTKTSDYTEETTLYAQWVPNNCTVTFDVNGGNDLINEDEKEMNTTFDQEIGELPVVSKRGYTFTGWYTAYDEYFTDKSLVNNVCNCSLIAHWIPNKYNVTFDVNRGDKLNNDKITVTFDSIYGELPSPTRDGFKFAGWITSDNEEIIESTVVNITEDSTLYANWTAYEYTVKLDENGGAKLTGYEDGIMVPADRAYDYLPTTNMTGYTFAGWLTEDNELITNDTATTAVITRDQTLCAGWIPNNYTVFFNVSGGDGLSEEEESVTVTFNSTYGSLPTPTREGYTFDGWFDNDGELVTNATIVNITSDCTFRANWVPNTYIIMFNPCGGEELANITVTFDGNYSCLPVPSKEGYTFMWWYICDTKVKVDNETKVETARNHTLCAAWNRNTVSFDVNGGDELSDGEKEKEFTYDGTYELLPTPSRNGYTFDGWFNEDGKEITSDTKVEIVSDQTFHAGWTPNNYTMKLDVNGGNELGEGKNSINVTYDSAYGYLPTPTRTGYTFIGWYTEKNEYVTSEIVVTDACHCTLHANWTANTYIITFDVNGGDELSDDEKNTTVTYDGTYDFLPTPTRDGYAFVGWFDEVDSKAITEDTKVEVAGDQTLHATWIKIENSETTSTPTRYVKIVFEKEDMTEEEIREILGKFTNKNFDIMEIDGSKPGETTVIIRFNDVEDAEMFIKALNESSDSARHFIRYAGFNSWVDGSISVFIHPFMTLNVLLI